MSIYGLVRTVLRVALVRAIDGQLCPALVSAWSGRQESTAPQHRVAELAVAESLFSPGHDFLPSIESARGAIFCVLFTVAGLRAGAGRSDGSSE